MPDTTNLYTTIRNESGRQLNIPWLPPRGVVLADNEEHTFVGHPTEAIQMAFPGGRAKRYIANLEALLLSGDLVIVSTPNPVLYDATLEETKVVVLDDDALATATPSWVSDESESESEA